MPKFTGASLPSSFLRKSTKKRNSRTFSPTSNPREDKGTMKLARKSHYRSGGQTLSTNDIRVLLIELERLLFVMNRQAEDGYDKESSWHALQFRVDRCFSLWHSVESIHAEHQAENPSVSKLSQQRYDNLQNRVFEVCAKFSAAIAERREGDASDALIHRVFLERNLQRQAVSMNLERGSTDSVSIASNSETDPVDPLEDKFVEEELVSHRPTTSRPPTEAAVVAPSVQDLQKMQREQMEEAISHLASQLKAETARIHETLHGQTHGLLDKLEDEATENVQQVTQVAKQVEEHVQSSWNRNIGTWTLLFTMVGAFFFCLIIINMAPKGKGCVFFCREKPNPNEFCRTLPNGSLECIRLDEPPTEHESATVEGSHDTVTAQRDERQVEARRETCEMNEYGDCIETHETDSKTQSAFELDETRKATKEKKKLAEPVMEDSMFDGIQDDTVAKGKRPVLNRKHFSPRDVRNAANYGDFYLMEDYLTIKPEWVDYVDKNGWGPIHLSARRGDLRAIHFLKRIGADLTIRTVDGRTARDIALSSYEEGHPVINALAI